jgi:hypothetical protein
MSREYAMSRVRDALEKADGNHLKAQRLLIQWLEKDQSLLAGLVAPHMPGIIAHAIAHIVTPQQVRKTAKKVAVKEGEVGEFGEALLSSLKGGRHEGVGFGEPTPRNLGRAPAASKKHIDAINKIATRKTTRDDKTK